MSESSKLISIIGGSGFVGTELSKDLKKSKLDFKIFDINVDESNPKSIYMNVEKENLHEILCKDSNTIVNLAAVHRDDVKPVSKYDDVNVKGAINVCNAARKNNINRIIFTSSVAVYGFAKPNTMEDGEKNYFNDYGRTKHEAEGIYKSWFNEDPKNRNLIIIRPTVIFGEDNRGNVFNLLNQIASKRFLMIGDGKNIKSIAYVGNVSAFIKYCLSLNNGMHVFNYVDKPDMDVNHLVKLCRKTLFNKDNIGFRLPYIFGYMLGAIADLISIVIRTNLPISRIRIKKFSETTQFGTSIQRLDFIPPYDVIDALKKTIRYEFIEKK